MKNILVSIIMSVYNETLDELKKAVNSVLTQTFKQFELIIVIDNPLRNDIKNYLDHESDKRLIVVSNDKNIGLAMSMNYAASLAQGKYLARMDADDICHERRIEVQYNYMEKTNCDLTCTSYVYIDEEDKILNIKMREGTKNHIKRDLPYYNTIHHPTVMLKKIIFDAVGGYRDFPCAQDYDLWLRLYDMDISMEIINEVLFYYRIRSSSISQKSRFKQLVTIWYIQKLYHERKRNKGEDTYSINNYEQYLEKNHIYNLRYIEKASQYKKIKDKIDLYRSKSEFKTKRTLLILYLMFVNSFYRKNYLYVVRNKLCSYLKRKSLVKMVLGCFNKH